ncbi:MAG: bifunctional precorrin-2 dehydrogenase/sirohydrochlorin ferrochelatase [Myxococcota bacterium]
MSIDSKSPAFAVFLKLGGKRVVVVGGGMMALEKIPALLHARAQVTVIAPEIRPEIQAMKGLTLHERPFEPSDLDGAWYAVAAAPPEVNRHVSEIAAQRQIFVNAVDDLRYADAYLGGIVRKSGFTFAISSDGASPALTALLRRGLERLIPDELGQWLKIGRSLRPRWKADQIPFPDRRPLLLKAINDWHTEQETTS